MKSLFARFVILSKALFCNSGWGDLVKSDVLVLRHDADCGYRYAGKVYSPIADTITEYCLDDGFRVQTIATAYSRFIKTEAFNSPAAFNRPFFAIAFFSRILNITVGRKKSRAWSAEKKTGIWLRILDRVKPQLVIGIQPDISLCRACRLRDIAVYDIQHGVIDSSNSWYGELLERNSSNKDLPSGFLCWDQNSASVLEAWAPARGAEVHVVGHPWYQRFRSPLCHDQLVLEAKKSSQVMINGKPTILVALQWGLHIHYYANTDFNHVMCTALESVILETQHQYNWLLRLHPLQLTGAEGDKCEEYLSSKFGGLSGVEWRRASAVPLPLLLSQVDLHITDMSSVVIEASWFGIPSALLNPFLVEGGSLEKLYTQERQSGIATILPQEAPLINAWIEERIQTDFLSSEKESPRSGVRSFLDNRLVKNG